jgi:hypothetical protein
MTVMVLRAIIRVQFSVHLVAYLFHQGTILHISIVEEAIVVHSATGGLGLVLVVAR